MLEGKNGVIGKWLQLFKSGELSDNFLGASKTPGRGIKNFQSKI